MYFFNQFQALHWPVVVSAPNLTIFETECKITEKIRIQHVTLSAG